MAKRGKIEQNKKRAVLVTRHAERRRELRAIIADPDRATWEKREAQWALRKLPRDSSATRYRNRCGTSGRPRGHLQKFGLSRIAFREWALEGKIPGVRKASW